MYFDEHSNIGQNEIKQSQSKKIGRNDLCRCGSGKKYKKCCLDKDETETSKKRMGDYYEQMRMEDHLTKSQIATRKALDWISNNYPRLVEQAGEHLVGYHSFKETVDVLEKMGPGIGESMMSQFQNEYALLDYVDEELDETLLERFLKTEAGAIDEEERQSLIAKLNSRKTLYEVQEIVKDKGVWLKDYFSKEKFWVKERAGTHSFHKWDIIFARVETYIGDERCITGAVISFPRNAFGYLDELKKQYDEDIKLFSNIPEMELFNFRILLTPMIFQYWVEYYVSDKKELVNKDGDNLIFFEQKAEITDYDSLVSYFNNHKLLRLTWNEEKEKVYSWLDQEKSIIASFYVKKRTVKLEVNSLERMKKVQEIFLLDLKAWTKNWKQTEKRMSGAQAGGAGNGKIKVESKFISFNKEKLSKQEEKKLLDVMMQNYYDKWIDMPIPALEGNSPQQARKDARLCEKLITILKTMENHGSHNKNAPPFDMKRIKRKLNLDF